MSDLASYLAKNYLNASKPSDSASSNKKRKRKSKHASDAEAGLLIADDDAAWDSRHPNDADDNDGDENELLKAKVAGKSAEFRRATNKWTTIGSSAPSNAEQQAADEILSSVAAERRKHEQEDEDAPQIVEDAKMMSSGALGGLQSAAEVDKALGRRKRAEEKAFAQEDASLTGKGQETVFRDASGRVINVAMARAKKRAEEDEKRETELRQKDQARGDVQRAQRDATREKLVEAKTTSLARYADDKQLNDELKARDRWNDPMAESVAARRAKGRSVTGRPLYKGAFEPNRYQIRPGHRWDGVERGNGFEKKYFEARNKQSAKRDLEYAWEMDE